MAASYAQQVASKYNTYAATRSFETTAGIQSKSAAVITAGLLIKKEAAQIVEDIKRMVNL